WDQASSHPDQRIRAFLQFVVEQAIWNITVLNSYRPTGFSQVSQYMKGVYYVPSQHAELSPRYILGGKIDRLIKLFSASVIGQRECAAITTGTAGRLPLSDDSVDYVFTDPPFGENIFYADLNFLVEAWHGVTTESKPEAIIDKFKNKALPDYQHLMQRCFAEYHRVLKPGRWMTVVFSNSKASV